MSPWRVALVCSGRRQLADRHFRRRWCPSASHRPVPFLFPLGLSCPLYLPFLSLGRLCQRSPRTFPVSLLCAGSTRRLGGRGWHKASVSDCLPLVAPIGLSPPLILTFCGSERVLVVSTEPPDDLSCLTTPGVGCRGWGGGGSALHVTLPPMFGLATASRRRLKGLFYRGRRLPFFVLTDSTGLSTGASAGPHRHSKRANPLPPPLPFALPPPIPHPAQHRGPWAPSDASCARYACACTEMPTPNRSLPPGGSEFRVGGGRGGGREVGRGGMHGADLDARDGQREKGCCLCTQGHTPAPPMDQDPIAEVMAYVQSRKWTPIRRMPAEIVGGPVASPVFRHPIGL